MPFLPASSSSSRVASRNRRYWEAHRSRLPVSRGSSVAEVVLDAGGDHMAIGRGGEAAAKRQREFPTVREFLLKAGEHLMNLFGARIESANRAERAVVLEGNRAFIAKLTGDFAFRLELDRMRSRRTNCALERRIYHERQRAPPGAHHRRQLVRPLVLGESRSGVADFLGDAQSNRQAEVSGDSSRQSKAIADIRR